MNFCASFLFRLIAFWLKLNWLQNSNLVWGWFFILMFFFSSHILMFSKAGFVRSKTAPEILWNIVKKNKKNKYIKLGKRLNNTETLVQWLCVILFMCMDLTASLAYYAFRVSILTVCLLPIKIKPLKFEKGQWNIKNNTDQS